MNLELLLQMQAGQLDRHLQVMMKGSLEMARWYQTLKPGDTTTSFFSLRISSQPVSILIVLCLDVVARCTVQSVSPNILMSSSMNPNHSVNLENLLVLSFGLGPGFGSSASPGLQGPFIT